MDEETYAFEAREAATDQSGISIHAGFPNPSDDAAALRLDFNQLLVRHASGTFVFRIRGNDWRRFGIWDGDLAIVDRLLDARREDMVVWCEEGVTGFGLSRRPAVPEGAITWGVITALIHEFRKRTSS